MSADRLTKIKIIFWFWAVVAFVLLMLFMGKEQAKYCDYDMEILTVDCLLKRNAEELKQMEQEEWEKYNAR